MQVINIYIDNSKNWFICERKRGYTKFKCIEEVRQQCWNIIANSLEERAVYLGWCDKDCNNKKNGN